MIENIAQSAAARVGYIAKKENSEVPIGFIGAIKNLSIYKFPKVGTTINTSIEIIHEIFNVVLIEGVIKENEKLIAECEMKVFLQKENGA